MNGSKLSTTKQIIYDTIIASIDSANCVFTCMFLYGAPARIRT